MTILAEVVGDKELVSRLKATGGKIQSAVEKSIIRSTIKLQTRVIQKLNGEVLNVRTGRLRRSITQRVSGQGSAQVEGIVGTNLVYARVHELGFSGTENVRQHLRMMKVAFGKPVASPHEILVRAHSRRVDIPARSFLRSSLAELAPGIRSDLKAAIDQAVKA